MKASDTGEREMDSARIRQSPESAASRGERPAKRPGFFGRSMRGSLFIGMLAAIFIAAYAGTGAAGRYLLFLGWMLVNLLLWAASVGEFLGKRRVAILGFLLMQKLIWIGILVWVFHATSSGGDFERVAVFLGGFNTPFLVMVLKALGGVIVLRGGGEV